MDLQQIVEDLVNSSKTKSYNLTAAAHNYPVATFEQIPTELVKKLEDFLSGYINTTEAFGETFGSFQYENSINISAKDATVILLLDDNPLALYYSGGVVSILSFINYKGIFMAENWFARTYRKH